MMDPELNAKYVQAIKDAAERHAKDIETAHLTVDLLLCNLLTELGYTEVVVEWHTVDKWYA